MPTSPVGPDERPRSAPGRLTAAEIAALTPPASGRRYVAVGGVSGLYVVITASNQRSWQLQYRLRGAGRAGVPQRIVIGSTADVSLAEARRQAESLRGEIAAGIDPLAARRAALRVVRETPRMRDAVAEWLKDHVEVKKQPATARQYRRLWTLHARASLGGLLLPEVSQQHIETLHRRLSAKKITANRLLATLSSFFQWAQKHG